MRTIFSASRLVVERVGLGRVVELHVVGDERRGVELARLDQRQHPVDVGDHVGEAEPQGQALEPGEAERDLALAGVGADPGDGAGVAGEADRHRQRPGVADRVDDDVDPAPPGRAPRTAALRLLLGEVDRRGAELAAIASRCSTESIAKTLVAPPASAACTAQSPTGPSPSTATVSPARIPAWATAW